MEIIPVTTENLAVYDQLAQGYEAEFSAITGKKPDARGVFALDTRIGDDVRGFILSVGGLPAGLIAVRIRRAGLVAASVRPGHKFRVKTAFGQCTAEAWRHGPNSLNPRVGGCVLGSNWGRRRL